MLYFKDKTSLTRTLTHMSGAQNKTTVIFFKIKSYTNRDSL